MGGGVAGALIICQGAHVRVSVRTSGFLCLCLQGECGIVCEHPAPCVCASAPNGIRSMSTQPQVLLFITLSEAPGTLTNWSTHLCPHLFHIPQGSEAGSGDSLEGGVWLGEPSWTWSLGALWHKAPFPAPPCGKWQESKEEGKEGGGG